MSTQQVRILAVRERSVVISTDTAACGGCRSQASCGTGSTQEVAVPPEVAARLRGMHNAELTAQGGVALRAAAIAYLPPLVGLLAGLLVGATQGDAAALCGATVGFMAGIVVMRRLTERQRSRLTLTLNLPGGCGHS